MAKTLFDFRAQVPIPDAWRVKLDAIAERRGMRMAELIRQIIRSYLENEDRLLAEREYADQGGRLAADRAGAKS